RPAITLAEPEMPEDPVDVLGAARVLDVEDDRAHVRLGSAHGSSRVTFTASDPVGRTMSVPSSPSTTPRGGAPATLRRKMRRRAAWSGAAGGGGARGAGPPAATASSAASAGSVW